MYPLLLFSIASWCVIIERWLTYGKFSRAQRELFAAIRVELEKANFEQAKKLCLQSGSELMSAPLQIYLDHRLKSEGGKGVSAERIQGKAQRRIFEMQFSLRKYLWVLATVGSSAPFVGLFGTVVGIIRSFGDIAKAGKGGFSIVASGISEALIATAAGILVAVIAVIFYNYFQVYLGNLMSAYRNGIEDLKDFLE